MRRASLHRPQLRQLLFRALQNRRLSSALTHDMVPDGPLAVFPVIVRGVPRRGFKDGVELFEFLAFGFGDEPRHPLSWVY